MGSVLAVGGLCVYTLTFVTTRLPLADVGIAIAALGVLLQASSFRFPAPLWLFIAYIAWSFAGSFGSSFPDTVLSLVMDQLKLLCVMIIIANVLRTEGQIRFFLFFYLACFMAYPGRGTIINYMIGNTLMGRAVGNALYANPNELATQTLFALGVSLGLAICSARQPIVRTLCFASALVLLVIILLTQSRGAVIGLALSMAPVLLAIGWRQPGRMVASAMLLGIVFSIAVPSNVWNRLSGIGKLANTETIAEADIEGSAAERYAIYQVALKIAKDNAILGVGLGNYGEANARYAPELGKKDTHNTYLNLAAEVGVPGLLLWCLLVGSILVNAYRERRRRDGDSLAILQSWVERALWAYLVAALFGSYSKINVLYVMLALIWCSTSALRATAAQTTPRFPRPGFA